MMEKKMKEVMSLTDGIFHHFPSTVPWDNSLINNLDILYVGSHSGDKLITSFVENYIDDSGKITSIGLNTLGSAIYSLFGYNWTKLYDSVVMGEYDPLENYRMIEDGTDGHTGTYTRTDNTTSTDSTTHTGTDTTTTTGTESTTHTGTDTDAGNSTTTTTNTNNTTVAVDNDVYGYNSGIATNDSAQNTTSQQTDNSAVTQTNGNTKTLNLSDSTTTNLTNEKTLNLSDSSSISNNTSISDTDGYNNTHHLTRSGNIGVTTSQQMLDSEIKLREYNFWLQVFKDIDTILCLKVY